MSLDEVNLFHAAILQARTDPRLSPLYHELVLKHEKLAVQVHSWPHFLPWHRYWVLRFETAVRNVVDCRITIPYWDFTQYWRSWWTQTPFDSQHLGGNGQGKNCCVKDGPFREGQWNVTEVKGGGCLKRYFNTSAQMPSPRVMSLLLGTFKPHHFKKVSLVLDRWVHNLVHNSIGGYFFLMQAANDPTFWVAHSFIDKLWSSWQQRGGLYLKTPYADMTNVDMLGTPENVTHSLADFYDMQNLPGGVRVCYTESMSVAEAFSAGNFAGPSIPRTSLKQLKSWQVDLIIDQLDNDELHQISYSLALMSGKIAPTLSYKRLPGDCVRLMASF